MSTHGISKLSIIPGRAEPSDKSENITQVLFGEHYTIIEKEKKWLKIRLAHDNYECWIDKKQHSPLSEELFNQLEENPPHRSIDLLGITKDQKTDTYYNLPLGSQISFLEGKDFEIAGTPFKFKGNLSDDDRKKLIGYAYLYLNAPYLWGGRTPFGIDCSGFVQMIHLLVGIRIPRDAYQQMEIGEEIASLDHAKKGDLVFFGDNDKITHVGLLLSPIECIHASGKVRIDPIDAKGIKPDGEDYSHILRGIRRLP